MADGENGRARGIDRAISIFEHLREVRRPMPIGALAKALNAPRSSIYSLISRLTEAGILETNGDGDIFFGRQVYFYADAYLESQPVTRLGRDEVIRLSRQSGETAQLCVLVNNKYTVAFMHPGASLFRISSEAGVIVPIPWTASGRLLLGGLSDHKILELIPEEDFRLPSGEVLDRQNFLDQVREAHRQGVTETSGLSDPFTTCLAAAIRERDGSPVATLCFMVPATTDRRRKDELLEALAASAQGLNAALGRGVT
ncbi:IclR family transcriptional regulator [Palleronia sp. LCG004]|uniref:IclR family transcriptional regulator n=1 Tax=Palleronia sp. LCG004 TaxID=3079304 RepID=UPI002943361B|nr:IclR family transcriptional regulator [Palleronia sp. LCG004]WOI57482.1 IclR family transcriptional regulator [Palleronia sp. LCG004]